MRCVFVISLVVLALGSASCGDGQNDRTRLKRNADRTALNTVIDQELQNYRSNFKGMLDRLNGVVLTPDFRAKLIRQIHDIVAKVDNAQEINNKNGREAARNANFILTAVQKMTLKLMKEVKENAKQYESMVQQIQALESLAKGGNSRRKRNAGSPTDPWIEDLKDIQNSLEKSSDPKKNDKIKQAEMFIEKLENFRKNHGGNNPNPFQQWQLSIKINSLRSLRDFVGNEKVPESVPSKKGNSDAENDPFFALRSRVVLLVGALMNIKTPEGQKAFKDVLDVANYIDQVTRNPQPHLVGQAKRNLPFRIEGLEKRAEKIVDSYKEQIKNLSAMMSQMAQ